MSTMRKTYLLSILLVNLQTSPAAAGRPVSPSHPECFIPCDEKSCGVDIHCSWDPGPDPHSPTNYSLHWKSNYREWTSSSSVIDREFFNHGELHVWVEARNQHGSVQSQAIVFNTADIIKPPPPNITLRQQEPLEIAWQSFCDELHLSMGTCDVRNRIEEDKVWLEHEGGFLNTYTFESPLPCTVYEFQVRCACRRGLASEWSTIQRIRGPESAPVGELDIWKDCGTYPASAECALTWKILPISQACGVVLRYEITLQHNNGTFRLINVSTAEPIDQLLCYEMQCYLNSSLKDVSSVSVSAFNAYGATIPANLTMPRPDQDKDEQAINLKMNEENLTVSWDLPSLNLKEYVVQYKQVGCPPGQGFDWVKVNKNETTVFFKGQFKKYTPFQVSLFMLSHSRKIRHLSSIIGYSLEGIPSTVPSFKVISIAATQVTLFWEPIPLSKQNGVILYYQIGLDKQFGHSHNVSASPQYENKTFTLEDLSREQEYAVWIRAVTKAGSGESTSARFKTKLSEYHVLFIGTLAPLFLVIICIPFLYCFCRVENKMCDNGASCFCEKVPDPRNSQIFGHVKHQINDPLNWICIPTVEAYPKISVLEVVKFHPRAFTSTLKKTSNSDELPVTEDGCSQMDWQNEQLEDAVGICDKTDHKYGRQEYSKMVDSDEERDKEEEEDGFWNSSEEEPCTSGYEKHFMPTALEILESRHCQVDI